MKAAASSVKAAASSAALVSLISVCQEIGSSVPGTITIALGLPGDWLSGDRTLYDYKQDLARRLEELDVKLARADEVQS